MRGRQTSRIFKNIEMTTQKKSVENKFIDRISALYLKLLEEKQDETEAQKTINAFVTKALKKFGLSLAADKLEERTQKIAKLAVARAQKAQAEMERRLWLMDIKIGSGSSGYTISFLPDVRIRNTPEARDKWEEFLETLAPKTRIGQDPKTGTIAVLYRDGEWLSSLMLADDVRSFNILDEIHTINGDLIARGARVVNANFAHEVTVKGDLAINYELLRHDSPPLTIEGGINLYGVKSPQGESFTPDLLRKWGLREGHRLRIRNDIFVLNRHDGATQSWELTGENVLSSYIWQTGKWKLVRRERIDPAIFDEAHSRLSRICLKLGLGADFVAKSVSRTQENLDKICLYLNLAQTQLVKPAEAGDPNVEAAASLIRKLARVRAPFSSASINADAVASAIDDITDEEIELAAELSKRPRHKINEKLIRADLNYVTNLIDDDTDINDLLADGLTTARFLHATFKSDDSRGNLATVAGNIPQLFDSLVRQLPPDKQISFIRFLEDPDATIRALRKRIKEEDQLLELTKIESELRILKQMRPKELVRKITTVPFNSEDPDFQDDKALLNQLFALQKVELKDLPFNAERMLDLLIPRLASFAREHLENIRRAWKNGPEKALPMTAAIAEQLHPLSVTDFIHAMRRLLISTLDTTRKFNALSVAPASSEAGGKKETRAALPPDLVMAIRGRLSRMCLSIGVGRAFIDDYTDALVSNLRKIEYYLQLALGETSAGNTCLLDEPSKELVRNAIKNLQAIRESTETGQVSTECAIAIKSLSDDRLAELGTVLSRPRHQIEQEKLKRDLDTLKRLQDTHLTIEKIFVSPGRFLLFMNSTLESKEMKRTVSSFIKPVYFAIGELASSSTELSSLSLNDVLKNCNTSEEAIARFKDKSGDMDALKKLQAGLQQIIDKGIKDIISHLRKTRIENPPEELERDQELVAKFMAFEEQPLDALGLDSRQTSVLLLLSLESFIVSDLKKMFEDGSLEEMDAKSIIRLIKNDLNRQYGIIRVYNKLTTPAPKHKK